MKPDLEYAIMLAHARGEPLTDEQREGLAADTARLVARALGKVEEPVSFVPGGFTTSGWFVGADLQLRYRPMPGENQKIYGVVWTELR